MAAEDVTILKKSNNKVFVLKSAAGGEEFPLHGEMLVGREDDCDITLNSGHISRHHSKINVSPGGVYIEDLKSTNGTYVNGNKIKGRVRLNVGDEVAFDDLLYHLHVLTDERAETASPHRFPEWEDKDLIAKPSASVEPIAKHFKRQEEKPAAEPPPRASVEPSTDEHVQGTAGAGAEAAEDEDHTRFISPEHLQRFMDRNRIEHGELSLGSGPRLIVTTAPLRGKLFELDNVEPGRRWLIGRDSKAELYLNDDTISMEHAQVEKTDDGYRLTVLEAKNAMLVNSEVQTEVDLKHNDKLQIGRVELVFKTDCPAADKQNVPKADSPARSRVAMIIMFLILLFSIAAMFKAAG